MGSVVVDSGQVTLFQDLFMADSYSLPAIVCVTEMLSGAHSDSEFRNFTLEA